MKKLGLLLALFFIVCAFGVHPAAAQQPVYGYIPLLEEDYDTTLPRQLLSRQTYKNLVFDLLEAQDKGQIIGFEPDFYGGFVRVTLASGDSLRGLTSLNVNSDLKDVIVRPPSPDRGFGKQPPGLYISLSEFSRCFYISGIPEDTHFRGTLKTNLGEIVGASDGYSDATGYYWDCFEGPFPYVVSGYKVTFKRYDAGGILVQTYLTNVPRNTFKSVAKWTSTVTGNATPGLPYSLDWYHAMLDSENNYRMLRLTGLIPASGIWSDTYDDRFRGGDDLVLILEKATYFHFNFSLYVPSFTCKLRSNSCYFEGFPRKAVVMTLAHGGQTYTYNGTTDTQGALTAIFEDDAGMPILFSAGDVITATGATTETLPDLTALINRSTDIITGKAPVNNYFSAGFIVLEDDSNPARWLKTDADGNYLADFSIMVGIPDTGSLIAKVVFLRKSSGNTTILNKIYP